MTAVPTYAAIVATVAIIVTLIALYTTVSSLADIARGAPDQQDDRAETTGEREPKEQ